MIMKCQDCVYYRNPNEYQTMGTCEYPAPKYMKIGISGGNFVYADINEDCAVSKSLSEVKNLIQEVTINP